MNGLEIAGGLIIMVCAVAIVIMVMMMEGKQGAMNALSGANDSSYLGKNKSRTKQATLSRFTKYAGILFVAVTLVVYFISSKM